MPACAKAASGALDLLPIVEVLELARALAELKRRGYWIVGQNGDVFPFGDARFYGSTGGIALNRPIVTAAASRKT